MASQPQSHAAQNCSVLTVSGSHLHSPSLCDYHPTSLQCSVARIGYACTVEGVSASHPPSKFTHTDPVTRVENCVLDIKTTPHSNESSGFEGSAERLDDHGIDHSSTCSASSSFGMESSLSLCSAKVFDEKSSIDSTNQCLDHYSAPSSLRPAVPPHPQTVVRQRSVPADNTMSKRSQVASLEAPRRQSSPLCSMSSPRSAEVRSTALVNSFNKMNLRTRCRSGSGDASDSHNRSLPGTAHPLSSLEPIPQGQELSVQVHLPPTQSASLSAGLLPAPAARQSGRGDTGSVGSEHGASPPMCKAEKRKGQPCCSCRSDNSTACERTNRSSFGVNEHRLMESKYEAGMSLKFGPNSHGSPDPFTTSTDAAYHRLSNPSPRLDRTQTNIPGAHWAKELIGRLRSNSTHHPPTHHNLHFDRSTEHSIIHHSKHSRQRRHSAPRDAESPVRDPQSIDPRRLPKAYGPTSACLQFSKKPLHHTPSNSSTSASIPVSVSPGHHAGSMSIPSSVLKSSSWRPRKQIGRVRWVSQCTEDEVCGHSAQSHSNCSTVEEFREAVDLLAGRAQAFPSTTATTRIGVRVKRASESERLLLVSRSLSDSKEDFSICLFGQFDESHVYGTLFRHSTCYDVLPDSGKLVALDSELGVVRAIHALLENGVQAAPIWHSATQRVTGLFSQDFALHLLSVLYHYGSDTEFGDQPAAGAANTSNNPNRTEHGIRNPPSAQSVNLAQGLQIWGSKRLSDVLRLFYPSDHEHSSPEFADSALIVPPHMGLQKALCRLVHKSHAHRFHARSHSKPGASDPSTNNQEVHQPQEPSRSKRVPQDSMDLFDWVFPDSPLNSHTDERLSNSRRNSDEMRNQRRRHSSDPYGSGGAGCSSRGTAHSGSSTANGSSPKRPGPTGSHTLSYSPTHLIVMNPDCGNVLGLLGVDRLLSYLRLRLDELPYSDQMMSQVGCLPGLLWSERRVVDLSDAAALNLVTTNEPAPETVQLPYPVLTPQTPCYEALRILDLWLPQIPALPVVQSSQGAASAQSQNLLGFIAPGDLLNFVLGRSPDVAVSQPVGKILETKTKYCRFHQDCICYAHEPVATVVDRMFRLKVSCLVLLDAPAYSASSPSHLIGMVTSKDLLQAIVTVEPHYHHHHRRHHQNHEETSQSNHQPGDARPNRSGGPMVVDGANDNNVGLDCSDVSDPCANALGLTHSQHIRLQQTQSDLLLGLSQSDPLSRPLSASSLSSDSTFSAGCGSASDLEHERESELHEGMDDSQQELISQNADMQSDPHLVDTHSYAQQEQHAHRGGSSTSSSDRCACSCHLPDISSSPRHPPIAHIRPTSKPHTNIGLSQFSPSHSTQPGSTAIADRPVPHPPMVGADNCLKPSTWTMRHPTVPTTSTTVPTPDVHFPITGPAMPLTTATNSRKRRFETEAFGKCPKRDEDDSVFRMD